MYSACTMRPHVRNNGMLLCDRRHSDAWQLVPGLGNQPTDTYITEKHTYDAFQNTRLESLLREWGVDMLVIGGGCDQCVLRNHGAVCALALDIATSAVALLSYLDMAIKFGLEWLTASRSPSCNAGASMCHRMTDIVCLRAKVRLHEELQRDDAQRWQRQHRASLHEAALKAFKTAFGKVLTCEEAKEMFAQHQQG